MKRKTRSILSSTIIIGIISGVIGFGLFQFYDAFGTLNPYDESLEKTINISITRDYGKVILKSDTLKVPVYYCAKDVLNEIAEVEYEYSGGFIVSIDGLNSEFPDKYLDWFFFINGFMSHVGILEYQLTDGDHIIFDYHDWNYENLFWSCMFNNAIHTLKQGYQGKSSNTIICYENTTYQSVAIELKNYLGNKGINEISIKEDNFVNNDDLGQNNIILIGGYSMSIMRDYYDDTSTCGHFTYFKNATEIERIQHGNGNPADPNAFTVEETYHSEDHVGIATIAQNPFSPNIIGDPTNGRVVLSFSGLDSDSILNIVSKFINEDNAFTNSYGIIYLDGITYELPF